MSIVVDHLVPPTRLAALMVARRSEQGLDLVDMAQRSNGLFTPSYLEEVERGRLELTDDAIEHLLALYSVDAGPIIPQRHELVLDLDSQELSVGYARTRLESMQTDDVLERYVSLVYQLRGLKPGSDLVLRDRDLDVLSEGLGQSENELRSNILQIIEAPDSVLRAQQVSTKKIVAAAGILVGITAVGTLVLVGAQSGAEPQTEVLAAPQTLVTSTLAPSASPSASVSGAGSASATTMTGTFSTERSTSGSFLGDLAQSPAPPAAPAEITPDAAPVQATAAAVTAGTSESTALVDETSDADAVLASVEPSDVASDDRQAQAVAEPAAAETVPVEAAAVEEVPVEAAAIEEAVVAAAPAEPAAVEAAVVEAAVVEAAVVEAAVVEAPAIDAANNLGAQVEARIGYNFSAILPGWEFEWAGDSPTHKGLTFSREKRIVIYVEPHSTVGSLTEVFMHEVGHAIDLEYMTNAQRTEWLRMRNMPMVWWPGSGLNDFAVGAGDFAEAVAAVTVGSQSYSEHGPFTPAQLDFVRNVLNRA